MLYPFCLPKPPPLFFILFKGGGRVLKLRFLATHSFWWLPLQWLPNPFYPLHQIPQFFHNQYPILLRPAAFTTLTITASLNHIILLRYLWPKVRQFPSLKQSRMQYVLQIDERLSPLAFLLSWLQFHIPLYRRESRCRQPIHRFARAHIRINMYIYRFIYIFLPFLEMDRGSTVDHS